MEESDFTIEKIGQAKIKSPIVMSERDDDGIAGYVDDSDKIFLNIDVASSGEEQAMLELAGPRKKIYFNPNRVHVAILTAGGICPGLNNVIRSVVRCFWYRYGVRRISGVPFGYLGLLENSPWPMIDLNPDLVDDIQEKGGTILGSARGGGKEVVQIVDTLERENINILITIGGDGTQKGALAISDEIARRGLKISVVGVPKTIDNDLLYIDTSFGFNTAVAHAVAAVRSAHVEAKSAYNGIGLVKVMGRDSGFIAASTSLAQSDVNFCLIPENPFDLDGPNGLLTNLKKRILDRGHAVILVAEGAGMDFVPPTGEVDAGGNMKYQDIGIFLKDKIKEYFKEEGVPVSVKYIDPSYIIRSTPADSYDSIYCARLGAHAVHAAMAGKTRCIASSVNNRFVYLPIKSVVSKRNHVDTQGALWRDVLENTRQPSTMKN